jgi:hypothetical protein
MNDSTSFERYVAEAFEREGPGRQVPAAIHDDLLSRAGTSRQLPSWLASIKEPPMRISNTIAVGSPTARVVAIMAATLLLMLLVAGAGIAGSRLLAADSAIVVDPSGNGDYTTISEAVAVAQDGDTVLLRAGSYPESVTVSRSIVLRGDEPGEVYIEVGTGCTPDPETGVPVCPADVPTFEGFWLDRVPYGLLLDDTDAQVVDLGFRFTGGGGSGIVIDGGAPIISGITYDTADALDILHVVGGSAATIRDSDFGAGSLLVKERSPVTVENSRFGRLELNTGDLIAHFMKPVPDIPVSMIGGPGTARGNKANHILLEGPALVEGNEVGPSTEDAPAIGIASGEDWIIRDNVVHGSTFGGGAILVADVITGDGLIAGNTLTDNTSGITLGSAALVEGNSVTDGDVGIIIVLDGTPALVDNVVEGMSKVGISIGPWAEPVLTGNRSCGNDKDIRVFGTREFVIDESNEICVPPDA